MVGLDHHLEPAEEPECARTSRRNSRIGLVLFAIYLAVYAGYVFLTAFHRATMDLRVFAGLNLAICYGMLLILLAFALAILYGWLCRFPAAEQDLAAPLGGAPHGKDRRP